MNTGLKVLDAMTKEVVSVSPDTTIHDCAKKMKEEHVGSVIIVDQGKLVGILSEQDLVYKVVADDMDHKKSKVSEIMSNDVISIASDNDITDAILKMSEQNVRRLPVIEEGKVVGLVTMKDVLKIEPQLFEIIVDKIELREEKNKPIHAVGEREGICELCGNYAPFLFETEDSLVCKDCRDQ